MSPKTPTIAAKEAAKPALVPKLRFPEFEVGSVWERRKIGDMLTETPRPIDLEDETDYCLVTVKRRYGGLVSRGVLKGKEIKVSSQFLVKAGDFVVSKRQIVHEACGLVPHDLEGCVVSNEYSVLTAKTGCNIDFFNRFAQQPCVSASFLECSVGIVIEKMLFKLPLWLRREFLFPAIAEQKKIADCLSSLDELIAAQARKVDALKTHKKGLMQQLFPREGETQPRLRFPEFQNAGEWSRKTLEEIADIKSGSTPLRTNDDFFVGGTIPWVKTTDLNNSHIIATEEKITPIAKARINPVGSVLVAMYGGFNQIGRTGCLSVPAATNQAISVLRLDPKIALPIYVLAWLNAKVEDWKRIASSSRKDPNITGSDVAKFPITLPEVREQQCIANCLTSLDDLITTATQELDTLKTHKKGLMQQLFPSVEDVEA